MAIYSRWVDIKANSGSHPRALTGPVAGRRNGSSWALYLERRERAASRGKSSQQIQRSVRDELPESLDHLLSVDGLGEKLPQRPGVGFPYREAGYPNPQARIR